ncbi:hypothetical protein GCM10010441_56560 [Kitasatospora paracochleata]|uniref:Gram-positive cocci surface proteins LPxTG domain-containing protein n=1 Tax=Kitasatospora paracochleata TaxID=58354 RepID=A0ABT1J6S2_9ACTN|nr:hypothetical protein [Kitasatospora paracochleata]MCP2313132.1 hypothetical protein [Kitasatospora paracochleata]
MAALPYTRSAFAAVSSAAPSLLPVGARCRVALTGVGLALPLLLAGPALAVDPAGAGRAPAAQGAPAQGTPAQGPAAETVSTPVSALAVAQALAAAQSAGALLPMVALPPNVPALPTMPDVLPSLPDVLPTDSAPAGDDPSGTCPPTAAPTRSTPSPSGGATEQPDPSASASDPASPSPSTSTTPSESPDASPSASAAYPRVPHGEGGMRHQPQLAPMPQEPPSPTAEDPADGSTGAPGDDLALPPQAGGSDSALPVDPPAGDQPQIEAQARPEAEAAVPLHWSDPSALQLPLGTGLTLIGCGLLLIGLRLRRR